MNEYAFYSTRLGVVCLKLVLVMGVTWIFDVISWIHGIWYGDPHYIWMITDLINALQGVLIFLVIGCQPQVNVIIFDLVNYSMRILIEPLSIHSISGIVNS